MTFGFGFIEGVIYFYEIYILHMSTEVRIYSLFHEMFRTFLANTIGLPGYKNKRESVLEIPKIFYSYILIMKILNKK